MKQRNSLFRPALCAALGAAFSTLLLPACTPRVEAGMASMADLRDLKHWQTEARKAAAHGLAGKDQADSPDVTVEKLAATRITATRIAATRDPFAPFLPYADAANHTARTDAAHANAAIAEEPVTLHLLGTVHNDGTAYALLEAGKQVHCVALKASLPSYPISVAHITDQAIEIDRRMPDGSHRRSTLRQGE
jgi:Tfp pilus assembly protein PilP